MRINELIKPILVEQTLQKSSTSSWPTYLKNLLTAKDIGVGPQGERLAGQHLDTRSKEVVTDLLKLIKDNSETGELTSREITASIENTTVTLLPKKAIVPIKYIHKSAEIKGGKNDSGTEKKPWNEGEVSETILGAALYARFLSKKDIGANEVLTALKTFVKNPVNNGFEVTGGMRDKQSPIQMSALNKPGNNEVIVQYITNKSDLQSKFPKGVAGLDTKVEACAAYVNESSKVLKALEEADTYPGNTIIIKTDGVTEQKGTKADLEISIGKYKQLLSLKVNDVKQFGQDSGSSGSIVATFFKRFIPDLDISSLYMENGMPKPWSPETGEGWPDMGSRKSTNALKQDNLWEAAVDQVYKLTGKAYQLANDLLQEKINNPTSAEQVITDIYNGIIHHAQGSNTDQTLVILNPGDKAAWKELEFGPPLHQALKNYRLEVSVLVAAPGADGNHRLRVFGRPLTPIAAAAAANDISTPEKAKKVKKAIDDNKPVREKTDPEMLFQLRSYIQESGNMRNPVEMGPLLKSLTEVQQLENMPDTAVTPPTAKAPAVNTAVTPPAAARAPTPAVPATPQDTNLPDPTTTNPVGITEGKGDFSQAIKQLSGWDEVEPYEPGTRQYDFDDREGGYYAQGTVVQDLKTGQIKIEFKDDGEYGGHEINDTFNSIGDAMNALRNITRRRSKSGRAQNFDTLGPKTLAGPDDVYKTDRAGKIGTLTTSRMGGMKASSQQTMRGGPKGVLPEGEVDEAITRLRRLSGIK